MGRSCRRFAAAAEHPADRRAQFPVLAVNAAKPTTRTPLPLQQLGLQSLDVLASRFGFLRPEHPADPFIPGKRREVYPRRQNLWVGDQDASQIHRDGMRHSAGDHPGAHRSPIVASMRSKVALRSARYRARDRISTITAEAGGSSPPRPHRFKVQLGVIRLSFRRDQPTPGQNPELAR